MAFAESLTPQNPHDSSKPVPENQEASPSPASGPNPKGASKQHGPKDSLVSDGLEEDLYWDEEVA